MTVLLTLSKTANGSEIGGAGGDVLAGTSNKGLDFGQCANGSYSPIVGSQASNGGSVDLFIRHDAVFDPITDVAFYVKEFSGSYGGANTSLGDISTLLALGAADAGTTANNTDSPKGLSRGLHMDMSWNVSQSNQFLPSRETSGQKRIFGKNYSGKDGSEAAKAFLLHEDAASYYDSVETDASAPIAGKIGISTDTALGNRGHLKMRVFCHADASEGGVIQFDVVTIYSFTA